LALAKQNPEGLTFHFKPIQVFVLLITQVEWFCVNSKYDTPSAQVIGNDLVLKARSSTACFFAQTYQ
tara:strand:- start:86 stop:286 length:201 start_codon:yes stop_codon:yes gene_type:complete